MTARLLVSAALVAAIVNITYAVAPYVAAAILLVGEFR